MPASPKFKTIITDYGKQRLIAAMSPGGTKLTLTQMAVGDGGGNPTNPDTTSAALVNEVWRAAVNSVSVDKTHSNIIIVELLIPAEVGGFWIREAGIYDEFNKLVAVCSLPASEKPLLEQGSGRAQTVRMTLVISDMSTINITIDSTTIIATNDYVDNSLKEHEKSRNHPDATLTDKGFVKLYSGVTSMDETMAATPKAVKIAMDNANERLAKARNLADLQSVPLALTNLTLANVKKAVEDTQIGLSKLPTFLPTSEDDLDALPVGFIGECKNKTPGGPLPTGVWCYIQKTGNLDNYSGNPKRKGGTIRLVCIHNAGETWTGAKFDDGTTEGKRYEWSRDFSTLNKPKPADIGALDKNQNGADIPDKPGFIKNVGLKETLNPTKRVSIGNIGTGAFDGSTPCINIGDSDSGFIGSADGVIDIYCNDAKVGYIDNAGLHMLAGIATNGNVVLQNDAREHIIIQNADGTPRMFIYKDKDGDGVHLNNGNDASTEYLFHNDGSFYAPLAVRAGGSKKLAVQANNNSTLSAMFNLWGSANRPTVIELDDDQGWHLYSQRNTDGSILFTVNGDIMANRKLNVGAATFSSDGNVNGSLWGGWLNDWINNTIINRFVRDVRAGNVESAQVWRAYGYNDQAPYVITGVINSNTDDLIDNLTRRPLQKNIGGVWYNIDFI